MSLLESLVRVSEKAANIARLCRQESHLFELLVQEKGSSESNPRFVQDFKTLADVLIQETVKHDVGNQFPEIRDFIKGEENNTFCNTLGESVCVQIQNDVNETAKLLEVVLNGDQSASELLAQEVHKNIALESVPVCLNLPCDIALSCTKELGIWIDPIDSTAEYISGKEIIDERGICVSGLRCVTVLIGVFNRTTGDPLIGIVNQPFHEESNKKWRGRCHWGMKRSSNEFPLHCCMISSTPSRVICLSSSEDEIISEKLRSKGFVLVEAAGAGYKILSVITGQADAYVLSKSTTFKWDTCGPQAILQSLGGDVVKFDDALNNSCTSLQYSEDEIESKEKINKYCNFGGIIAFREKSICDEIVKALNT